MPFTVYAKKKIGEMINITCYQQNLLLLVKIDPVHLSYCAFNDKLSDVFLASVFSADFLYIMSKKLSNVTI